MGLSSKAERPPGSICPFGYMSEVILSRFLQQSIWVGLCQGSLWSAVAESFTVQFLSEAYFISLALITISPSLSLKPCGSKELKTTGSECMHWVVSPSPVIKLFAENTSGYFVTRTNIDKNTGVLIDNNRPQQYCCILMHFQVCKIYDSPTKCQSFLQHECEIQINQLLPQYLSRE